MTSARVKRHIDSNQIFVELKTFSDDIRLTLDRSLCQACDICSTVCPKDAMTIGPVGGGRKGYTTTPTILIDENKCVLCGTCAIMCPYGALNLEINEETNLILTEFQALPPLASDELVNEKTGVKGQNYLNGEISVDATKCPGGCSTCVDICPFEAFYLPRSDKPWDKVPRIAVDKEKCIFCGACVLACPAFGAITLERKEVKWGGTPTRFSDKLETKLKQPKRSRMYDQE